jgi:hypothetical protein
MERPAMIGRNILMYFPWNRPDEEGAPIAGFLDDILLQNYSLFREEMRIRFVGLDGEGSGAWAHLLETPMHYIMSVTRR